MITSKHLIETQIPYHIRESNPLFTKFLEYYYEFLEESKINSIIQDILSYGNADLAEEYFLKNLFEELKILPSDISVNRRLIAKHIYDLYRSKGTETGLKLLLKVVTNIDANLNSPYDNVLRASNGVWSQENFVTVKIKSGELPSSLEKLILIQDNIEYTLSTTRYEITTESSIRFYYTTAIPISPIAGNTVYINIDNYAVFVGIVELSPHKIVVQSGGKGWQVGQIIVFPGNGKDTIAKVSKIDSNGSALRFDIIQYGFGHSENAMLEISPYGARPLNARYTIDIETTAPNVRTHTLKIYDGIIGASEKISGTQIGFNNTSYYLSDYNMYDYNGNIVINVENTVSQQTDNANITIEEWLESKAILILTFNNFAKMPGKWLNDNGQLSNEFAVLQDNKYYQINSYEIESYANPTSYKQIAQLVHPAGTVMYTRHIIDQVLQDPISITTEVTL